MGNVETLQVMQEIKTDNESNKNYTSIPEEAVLEMDKLVNVKSRTLCRNLSKTECINLHRQVNEISLEFFRELKRMPLSLRQ